VPEHRGRLSSSTQTVARQVREARTRRGWSTAELARACARLGAPHITRSSLANLEGGRRSDVALQDVFVLAAALGVAPVHLMVPTDKREDLDLDLYQVVGDLVMTPTQARDWIRGTFCPPGTDPRDYYGFVPPEEFRPLTAEEQERGRMVAEADELDRLLRGRRPPITPTED
jgi:transcriptional regulator with XRE-family HTH domain